MEEKKGVICMPHTNISEFIVGQKYSGAYIVKTHAVKPTKNGSNYLNLVIFDKTGELNCNMWNIPPLFNADDIVDGYYIAVALTTEEYQGRLQGRIDNIKIITDESKINKSELIPTAPDSADKMYNEILTTINDMANTELQRLCFNVVMENKNNLMSCPGAKSMHHAELSGLLHHVTGMIHIGKAILSVYPQVNADLLLAGIILHDICKPKEFALGPLGLCVDYTKKGKLLGHITMGVAYIERKCSELGISEEVSTLIGHMILSHHGEPDFGSAVRPMFLEAILLNKIDDIDAKVNMCENALNDVPAGSFSDKIFGFGGIQLYQHGLKSEE